jgi:hypothetical protein
MDLRIRLPSEGLRGTNAFGEEFPARQNACIDRTVKSLYIATNRLDFRNGDVDPRAGNSEDQEELG